jgi:DNA-binding MarR family transcriptional regulator
MQRNSPGGVSALVERLIGESLPGLRGIDAWQALLNAHASLMRRLDADLREQIGLPLNDFDVLGQLGNAGGELRMSELAARVYMSRSGMTRRVAGLIDEGLVGRCTAQEDGRGVVVALTDAGVSRLAEALPIHLRCVSKLFVEQLDDQELEVLERALAKVARTAGLKIAPDEGKT